MKLRTGLYLYMIAIHLLFGGALLVSLADRRWFLLAAEVLLAVSLVFGLVLVHRLFRTLTLIDDGAELMAERDFSVRFVPTGHADLDRLVAVYNTMADRLREERLQLQEQQYFLDKIITASPSGLITLDHDGRVATVNPAARQLLNIAESSLMRKRLEEIESPLATGLARLADGEARVLVAGGRRRLKCWKSGFMDRGFRRQFLLLEEMTEELRLSEKAAYEKLIRVMSHEVNNTAAAAASLLHSCLAYAPQLPEADRADYRAALTAVINRSRELNAFMKAFADVVRLPQPKRSPVDPVALAEDVRVMMAGRCAEQNVSCRLDAREELPLVAMDRGQMEQVLVNILQNALDAVERDGAITIRLGLRDGRVFLAVEDSGPGIAPEEREKLFTPFFSTKPDGQGIGLTLVREILENHGFDYSLESPAGGPTRFSIVFKGK